MRVSQLLTKTLREEPAEADTISHSLLLRAGMIYQVAAGVYAYLPLAWRALRKIEQIVREEMNDAGGQEVMLPALQPLELWEKTGRTLSFGQSLFTLSDRKERKLCLGPTHEEVITEIVHRYARSYRDLPLLLYQIQTKFRDEPRPRGGLLRVREFDMMDLYSFDSDVEGLDISYRKMIKAYKNIYERCGLATVMVEADSGAIGGKESHEFMVITETGEDAIIYCSDCGYAANAERAQSVKPPQPMEEPLPLEEVATPNIKTIKDLASFLQVPESRTLKAVFYAADNRVVLVLIRGDLEVNEVKLKNVLKCNELRLATAEELEQAGMIAGFASPRNIKGVKVVADDSICRGSNFVAGANRPDYHLKNVNYPRDFSADLLLDIALTQAGQGCLKCGSQLLYTRGIEVGHVFKLGIIFSEKLGAYFIDRDRVQRPIIMGCYGIGMGRLLAAAIEQNHDEKGVIFPLSIAPYQVYLCALGADSPQVMNTAEKVYAELQAQRIEVLFDDRLESPGVKFNDADLLGIPLRLTISPRTLKAQSVEVKGRADKEFRLIPLEEVAAKVGDLIRTS